MKHLAMCICAAALVLGFAGIWLLEKLFRPDNRKDGKR